MGAHRCSSAPAPHQQAPPHPADLDPRNPGGEHLAMKFTEKLRFNAVPEWREHYLNYASEYLTLRPPPLKRPLHCLWQSCAWHAVMQQHHPAL